MDFVSVSVKSKTDTRKGPAMDEKDLDLLSDEEKAIVNSAPPDQREKFLSIFLKTIEAEAKNLHKEIGEKIGEAELKQQWLPFAPMPTPLCRVSPFFPMAKQNLKNREYIEDMVISDNAWGYLSYKGPKLSVFDEDILLAVLALLDSSKHAGLVQTDLGETTTYKGKFSELLKLTCLTDTGINRTRIKKSLDRLSTCAVELAVYERTGKRSGKKRKVTLHVVKSLVSLYVWNKETKELRLTINPFFRQFYLQERVTALDVLRRSELKSPIAKALFRFLSSHRGDTWKGHFLTLARALNMDLDNSDKQLRRLLKNAIKELVTKGFLSGESGIIGSGKSPNVVNLVRKSGVKKIQ